MSKDGIAIMATKMYYFGVGGSLNEFEDFFETNYSE